MKQNARAFDWPGAYARLEAARRVLEAGREPGPDETERILKDRARALARRPDEARSPAETLEFLVFSLSGERYAVETGHVLEVFPLRGLTPVPLTPPFILGVVNYRGRILTVLDLRRLIGMAGQERLAESRAVAVQTQGMTFGILADEVTGIVQVAPEEVTRPPAALTGDRQALVRGMTPEMAAVLDLEALALDRRIVVKEEVG